MWVAAALFGGILIPQNRIQAMSVFIVVAIPLLITFQRFNGLVTWSPVLRVTPRRLLLGKLLLAAALLIELFWILIVKIVGLAAGDRAISLGLNGLALLAMVYVAVHWALHPDNLFSESFQKLTLNPLA